MVHHLLSWWTSSFHHEVLIRYSNISRYLLLIKLGLKVPYCQNRNHRQMPMGYWSWPFLLWEHLDLSNLKETSWNWCILGNCLYVYLKANHNYICYYAAYGLPHSRICLHTLTIYMSLYVNDHSNKICNQRGSLCMFFTRFRKLLLLFRPWGAACIDVWQILGTLHRLFQIQSWLQLQLVFHILRGCSQFLQNDKLKRMRVWCHDSFHHQEGLWALIDKTYLKFHFQQSQTKGKIHHVRLYSCQNHHDMICGSFLVSLQSLLRDFRNLLLLWLFWIPFGLLSEFR